ncbi:MAG: hypothetical protein KJZ86_05300 [Caldilineaceae bacterium]|nr:hypothetical protein [Caldilineaceae bacterium]
MNEQTNQPIVQSPSQPITQSSEAPKETWTEPVLRKTPIAETAGSKPGATGDGLDGVSS